MKDITLTFRAENEDIHRQIDVSPFPLNKEIFDLTFDKAKENMWKDLERLSNE